MSRVDAYRLDVDYIDHFTPELFHCKFHLDDGLMVPMMDHTRRGSHFFVDLEDLAVVCKPLSVMTTDTPCTYDGTFEIVSILYPDGTQDR